MRVKLQYKIAILVFSVGILLVLIGVGVHKKVTKAASYQKTLHDIQSTSQEMAILIDSILQEKANKVQAFSSTPVIETLLLHSNAAFSALMPDERKIQIAELNKRWRQEDDPSSPFIQAYMQNPTAEFLKKQLKLHPEEYGEIFLTNRFGALVATTGKLTTLAHGHKYWWQKSFNQGKGKIFFDDRGVDTSVGGCVLGIVVPIKKDGQIIGILKSNIMIQRILSKVVQTRQLGLLHQEEKIDHSHVQRAIVRKGGRIVTQPGIEPLSAEVPPQIKSLLSKKKTGSLLTDIDGIPTFVAFSQIPITNGYDHYVLGGSPQSIDHIGGNQNEDWNIVISQPVSAAMNIFQQSNELFYLIAFLLTVFIAVLALFIGRWITKPINSLLVATRNVGQGDFSTSVAQLSRNDELAEVTASFNEMAMKLDSSRNSLIQEQKQRLSVEKELMQKSKMEAVGSLAGGIAHNFNNNLAIILGNIELATMKISDPGKANSYLDSAKTAITRSRDLIRQIMIFSHQGMYEKKIFNATETLAETLIFLGSTIPTTVAIKTRIDPAVEGLAMYGDEVQIQQSLLNLCTNAVHAMHERGILEIVLSTFEILHQKSSSQFQAKPGSYLCLSVTDNGCGMDKGTIKKIFFPFFTTKEVGKGTGMGLATVRGVINHHQGFIDVQSVVGEGTTIALYLPAVPAQATVSEEKNELFPGGTEKILFVDDEETIVTIGKEILESMGYRVEVATRAEHALELFKQEPEAFNLVITDQIMPEMTGKELILELKKVREDIPVILCTGHDTQISAEGLKALRVNAFCLKPLQAKELAKIIRESLHAEDDP